MDLYVDNTPILHLSWVFRVNLNTSSHHSTLNDVFPCDLPMEKILWGRVLRPFRARALVSRIKRPAGSMARVALWATRGEQRLHNMLARGKSSENVPNRGVSGRQEDIKVWV